MSDLPATPPQVSYQNGMLTIVAQNSTLGDILREIHKQTGASIDMPANATERVATRLGPGPARDVLTDLLNGSTFNYVIVGTPANPTTLASVVLTPKPVGNVTESAAVYQPTQQYAPAQPVQAFPAPGLGPGGQVAQAAQGDDEADSADEDADENADQEQDQAGNQGNVAPDGSQPPNGGPKTPEQILEMLRQRQQQAPNNGQFPIQRQQNNPPQQQSPPDEQ